VKNIPARGITFVHQDWGKTVAKVLDFRLASGLLLIFMTTSNARLYDPFAFRFLGLFLTLKHLFSGMQSDHSILINPEGELVRFGIMSSDTFRLNTADKGFVVWATTDCFTLHCCLFKK
jgi:hypothetical protein